MGCDYCRFYQKFYTYSKKYGFEYIHQGRCEKRLTGNSSDCYGFEKEESEFNENNFNFENIIIEMAIKCEEINKQLNNLLELYKNNGKVYMENKSKKNNTIICFK